MASVSASSEFSSFRDNAHYFTCPVNGCGLWFLEDRTLQQHINQSHTYSSHPDVLRQPRLVQRSLASNPPVLLSPSPTNNQFPPRPRTISPSPHVCNPLKVPIYHISQPEQTTATYIPPTTNLQQDPPIRLVTAVSPPDDHWPSATHDFLKSLILKHALFEIPRTPEEHAKIIAIFDEFYDVVDFFDWKPAKSDQKLWQMFRVKLEAIQLDILRGREVHATLEKQKTQEDPRIAHSAKIPRVVVPVNTAVETPPTTPVISKLQFSEGLDLWNKLDADAQIQLFRAQLRMAKDSQRMVLEWETYSAKINRKEVHSYRSQERERSEESLPRKLTPLAASRSRSVTPRQVSTPIDMKALFETRLHEAKLKKELEKHGNAAKTGNPPKRMKLDM